VVINGGVRSATESLEHVKHCDGVMIGREAYQNPYSLIEQEQQLFGTENLLDRKAIVLKMLPYIQQQLDKGLRLHHITRHMIGLFNHQPGGKQFRRHLSEYGHQKDASINVLQDALALTEQYLLDE